MGEVAGAQDRDALAPGPPGELREVSIAAGGSGVAGVDVQIGIKPHGPLPFTPDDRYPAVGPGVGERDRRVVRGSGRLGRVLELLGGLRPGDLGSGGRPGSAPDGGGEQQPEAAPGALRQGPGRGAESSAEARTYEKSGIREVHVLLSMYGSRGTLNRRWDSRCGLRALGAEVRVCAPPDCAEQLAEKQWGVS